MKKNSPIVLGEGPQKASLCIIGEAPGKEEEKAKRPFVGRSGKLLDQLLDSLSLPRSHFYITNLIKRRLKAPLSAKEIQLWKPSLLKELAAHQPKVLLCLGRHASRELLLAFGASFSSLQKMHGKLYPLQAPWGKIFLIALYHPAAALRNRKIRLSLTKDFQKIKKKLQYI